jgi:hypothetical protein
MRIAALYLTVFIMGCSSSSSNTPDGDASSGPHDDAGRSARDSGRHDAATVCAFRAVQDSGTDAGGDSSALDARADSHDAGPATATDADAGPIHCVNDTQCPTGHVCDTKAGALHSATCIPNAGATLCVDPPADGGGAPGMCSENSDDMCCTVAAGCVAKPASASGQSPCCPGAQGDSYCQTKLANSAATCSGNVCTTCLDTCVASNPAAYQKFLGYQLNDCGCTANGACYSACHDSETAAATSPCGMCLAAQTAEDLNSTCTLTAALDCSNDKACTAYQACAGACPM